MALPSSIGLLIGASGMEVLFLALRFQGDLRFRIPEAIGLLLLTAPFYLVSCWLILGRHGAEAARPAAGERSSRRSEMLLIVGAAVLFRLTLWGMAPSLSDDVFRYRWEGLLQAAGGNPYQTRPNDPEWAHLRDETFDRIPARNDKAGYGPLTELIERGHFALVSSITTDAHRQAFWFKLPSAVFDLGVILALLALLAARGLALQRVLIYAWCPLPLAEFWGTGHNDAIAVFCVVLALALAARERWWGAFTALSLGACAKIWPLILFPIFVGWKGWRPCRWYQWSVLLPITGLLAIPFWSNVEQNARFMSGFLGGWRNNDSGYGLLLWLTGDQYAAKDMAFTIIIATVLLVTLRHWRLEKASLTSITVMLVVSANCHPWYVTWIIPLLAVVPVPALFLWAALMPLAYRVVIAWTLLGEWDGSTPWRWLIHAPAFSLLAVTLVIGRIRSGGRGLSGADESSTTGC